MSENNVQVHETSAYKQVIAPDLISQTLESSLSFAALITQKDNTNKYLREGVSFQAIENPCSLCRMCNCGLNSDEECVNGEHYCSCEDELEITTHLTFDDAIRLVRFMRDAFAALDHPGRHVIQENVRLVLAGAD